MAENKRQQRSQRKEEGKGGQSRRCGISNNTMGKSEEQKRGWQCKRRPCRRRTQRPRAHIAQRETHLTACRTRQKLAERHEVGRLPIWRLEQLEQSL